MGRQDTSIQHGEASCELRNKHLKDGSLKLLETYKMTLDGRELINVLDNSEGQRIKISQS